MPAERSLHCFAVAAPGLEPLVADELRRLATLCPLEIAAPEPGGVEFQAGRRGLYAANLHLRTASRVLVRMGCFHASAFHELERQAAIERNLFIQAYTRAAVKWLRMLLLRSARFARRLQR